MLPQHPRVAEFFKNYFFSHNNCFPDNVHLKKRSNKSFFEIVPTKNLIQFLCYFIYLFLFIFTNSNSNNFFMKITTVEMNWFRRPYVLYKLVKQRIMTSLYDVKMCTGYHYWWVRNLYLKTILNCFKSRDKAILLYPFLFVYFHTFVCT